MTSRQQRRRNQSGKNQNSDSGQKNWLLPAGAVVVVIAIALVVISVLPSGGTDPEAEPSIVASGGSIIGDPNAPVTLVEFGDFQ